MISSIWLKPLLALLAVAAIIGGVKWYGVSSYKEGYASAKAQYDLAILNQKVDAEKLLNAEKDKNATIEKSMRDVRDKQDKKDSDNAKIINDQKTELARLRDSSGRLRDPNATGCGISGGSASSTNPGNSSARPADGAETSGLLSKDLSGLLLSLTSEADQVNIAYGACKADALNIRR